MILTATIAVFTQIFSEKGIEWERPVTLTYMDADRSSGFQTDAGLRIHGNWTRTFFQKKSFRLYFRRQYGLNRIEYPLFDAGENGFKRLVLHNSGQSPVTIVNQLVANLAWQQGGNAARSQPVLLFINGRLWGIYQIRERIDQRFLALNYGLHDADFLDTPDNVDQQSVYCGG